MLIFVISQARTHYTSCATARAAAELAGSHSLPEADPLGTFPHLSQTYKTLDRLHQLLTWENIVRERLTWLRKV